MQSTVIDAEKKGPPKQVSYDPFAQGELDAASLSTAPQRELWVASLVGGEDANRAYNECLFLKIKGELRPDLIRAALQGLVERHETMRGLFSADGDHFIIDRNASLSVEDIDLSTGGAEAAHASFDEICAKEVQVPFDLTKGPLYRVKLIRLSAEEHRLVFSAHHVACDGWSAGVLIWELAEMYRAALTTGDIKNAPLPPARSFTEYATTQQTRARSAEGENDFAYWLKRLNGELSPINLPTDHARPTERTYSARRVDIPLDGPLLQSLRKTGAKAGCTLLVTFIGAMQAWLQKCTGQEDLVIGVPSAGQALSGDESLVGHCVHLLPVRGTLDPKLSFHEHLRTIKPDMASDLDHQQVTFSSLLPKLQIPLDNSRIGLVPVCVNIDVALKGLNFGGPEVDYETIPRDYETFEFFLNAVDYGDRMVLECSYNTALFEEATIRRWMRQFQTLVARVVEDPVKSLGDISLFDADDEAALAELNNTVFERTERNVHHLVSEVAVKRPDETAVEFGKTKVSYRELDERSNQLAHLLIREGVKHGDNVGIGLPRSEKMVIALLAVFKAGAAYVPMDPTYPKARTQMMADDSEASLVIGSSLSKETLPNAKRQLFLDEVWPKLADESTDAPSVSSAPTDRAYILFTSGSTGRPKGVDVPHRALQNVVEYVGRVEPGLKAGERSLAITTISFDIACVEIWMPLVVGGTVVLLTSEQAIDANHLKKTIADGNIDYMQATPATWTMLLDSGWKGEPEMRIAATGEAFPPELVAPLCERGGGGVFNLYGPTETTIYSSIKKMKTGERVTIGKPLDNTQFYILDSEKNRVPTGSTGELWIGGVGVTNGYVGRDDLTKERFVADPFLPGNRMYKSGDLVRILPSGDVECLGRTDFQVKIRGFRIELEEIEAAIASFPSVQRSVVMVQEMGEGDKRLVAYVKGPDEGKETELAIREHVTARLSPYMVPQHVVVVSDYPMTPNGKVDRKKLPKPQIGAPVAAEAVAPRNPIEETLSRIICELLERETLSIDDNFFELGATSLHSIRMVDRINKVGIRVTPTLIFQHPTIRRLAEAAMKSDGSDELTQGTLVPLREHGDREPLFFVHSLPGDLLGYGHLVHQLGEDQPIFGFHGLGGDLGPSDLTGLAKLYAKNLMEFYPKGRVNLVGWCFGGTFAVAIAQCLQAQGREIGLLGLMETWPSRSRLGERAQTIKSVLRGKAERMPSKRAFAKHLLQGEPAEEGGGFALEITDGPFARREEFYSRNRKANEEHRSSRFNGVITLIRSGESPAWSVREHDYGWSEFCSNVVVHKIEAEHREVIHPPHAETVAQHLRDALDNS